jgi:hypothetical protein
VPKRFEFLIINELYLGEMWRNSTEFGDYVAKMVSKKRTSEAIGDFGST